MSQTTVATAATVFTATMAAGSAVLTDAAPFFVPQQVGYTVTITNAAPGTASGANGSITNGLKVLTSISNIFTAGMVGKYVSIPGAGPAGATLLTTIAQFNNAGSVNVTDAASTTVTTSVITVIDATLTTTISSYQSAQQVTLAAAPTVPVNLALQVLTLIWSGSATLDTSAYPFVTFSSPLAGGDTVTVKVFLPDGQTAPVAMDINGVSTGLSSANPSRIYVGGPTYLLTKVGTGSQAGAYADFGSRRV